ncbi:N-acetyltransferase [Patescibacteria group bacterium]|nr:MAG: N-acetyltransferase [Patescibacteria group bacterium]
MDFKFTSEYPFSKLDEIVAYLLGPCLWIPQADYPDFLDWAEKTWKELQKESKGALIALSYHRLVGVTIYQRHKQYPDALEIKNLTVRPDQRGRYIASFLLRNTEIEGTREFSSRFALCDAKARNLGVRGFLLKHPYRVAAKTDLYNLGAGEDLVYQKKLAPVLLI